MSSENSNTVVYPLRPYIESILFVAAWIAFGWLLKLSSIAYLVIGVPLVGFFQLVVRGRPLRELWMREPGQSFRLDGLGVGIALALMVVPAYQLFTLALPERLWVATLFLLCALMGGIIAGYAFRSQRADALQRGLPSFGAALLIGLVIQAIDLDTGRFLVPDLAKLPFMIQKFLLYIAIGFTLEEVVFRGALDTHVYPPGERGRARAWGSALFVSALWGLWHLPIAGEFLGGGFLEILILVLLVHILEGIPLSFCWRQSGTLVLPVIAHALIDAYRDGLLL